MPFQAKAIAVDTNLKVVYDGYVSYDDDLPEFGYDRFFFTFDYQAISKKHITGGYCRR